MLLTDAWRKRRNEILKRDKLICQDCSNVSYFISPFQNKEATPIISVPFDILEIQHAQNDIVTWRPAINSDFHFAVQMACAIQETVVVIYKGLAIEQNPYALLCVDNKVTNSIKRADVVNKLGVIIRTVYTLSDLNAQGLITWLYVRNLQIHHTYYQQGKLPWDYPDSALITLCQECHHKRHKKSNISVIDSRGNIIGYVKPDMLHNVDDEKPVFMKID